MSGPFYMFGCGQWLGVVHMSRGVNRNTMHSVVILFLVIPSFKFGSAIWCYRCTSATPGCGEQFNWRGQGYLGEQCPDNDDICVKVIEQKGAQQTIIRDCLSSLYFRTDIPADHYEGCRTSAKDIRLAHYVNHTIKEHDIKRDYFTNVMYCFCFLDHRCNSADALSRRFHFMLISITMVIIKTFS